MTINKKNLKNIFYIFLTLHLIIWTFIPTITNQNLPLDTIEALAWGSNLDWGFNKHPPMSAFLVEIFYKIFGAKDWAYYLLSQICIIITFYIVFKFAEEFFENKFFSLLSVLLLEGIYFYNFTTPEFNVNICLMPFWALTVFYLWKSFKKNKITDWLLFGLFTGFGFLSKYSFIYLSLSIDVLILYMIFIRKIDFKCLVSLVPFLIILLPHLIWLSENNYTTINYGFDRASVKDSNIFDHLKYPLIFLAKQIAILIPLFLMFVFLNNKLKIKFSFRDNKLLFLLAINIIPLIFVFLTSVIMGAKIRTMWISPFYLFLGVLLIYVSRHKINLNKLKGFTTVFLILFILSPFTYAYVSITENDKRTDYPGKKIAIKAQEVWDKNRNEKIVWIIGGSEWTAGNLSYHLEDRPKWILEWHSRDKFPDAIWLCGEKKGASCLDIND